MGDPGGSYLHQAAFYRVSVYYAVCPSTANLVKLFCACWIFEPGEESDVAMKARELDFLQRCFQADNDVSYRLLISPEFQTSGRGICHAFPLPGSA